jgi:hypothetical protein
MSGVEPRRVVIGRAEVLLECDGIIMGTGEKEGEPPFNCTLPFVT